MKHHIHNPWTRSPRVHVSMSVEEVHQLAAALAHVLNTNTRAVPTPEALSMDANQQCALRDLQRTLQDATTRLRHLSGIKGATP